MNFNEIKEIIELINNSDLSYLEIQNEKDYIKMDKSLSRNYNSDNLDNMRANKLSVTDGNDLLQLEDNNIYQKSIEDSSNYTNESILSKEDNEGDFDYIKSPIVGTFYESVSPDSDPFVNVGQKVNKGEVVCIIEAMKLMNEITAEHDCEIVDILAKDGQMVEYAGQLFKTRRL